MVETKKRSLAKMISWALSATLKTILIVYLFSGNLSLALGIGSVEIISKLVLYYTHERVWDHISWGLDKSVIPQPESEMD